MGLNIGSLVSALAPIATQVIGSIAGGALGGAGRAQQPEEPAQEAFAAALGGGAGGALGGAAQLGEGAAGGEQAQPGAARTGGTSQALGGIGSLLKTVNFTGIARMFNPKLPPDQANLFSNLGPYLGTFLEGVTGGGGASAAYGEKADASKAGQYPGTPDEAAARIFAQKAIAQIDWSKPNIALWVPGTGSHEIDPGFKRSMGADTSAVAVDYPATIDFPNSVSTGMLATKLVLEEVERRGRTASLTGYSQGAWVAGEVMADPKAAKTVTRAVLFGHPNSANAQYEGGANPKVRVVNNADEQLGKHMSKELTPIAGLSNLVRGRIDGESIAGTLSGLVSHGNVVAQLLQPSKVGRGHAYDLGSQAAFLKGR